MNTPYGKACAVGAWLLGAGASAATATPPPVVPFDAGFSAIEPIVGAWEFTPDREAPQLAVRGDRWTVAPEAATTGKLNRIFQGLPESLLDGIKAYYYFPLALVRNREFAGGTLQVDIKPVSGSVDRAGGIAFGMVSPGEYWVLRLNALEDNVMLFEYVRARRLARHTHRVALEPGRWYTLAASVNGRHLRAMLDGRILFDYTLPGPGAGRFGLWSKADSRTIFRRFTAEPAAR